MSGTVDDLSDSDEDDFPPGFLTSNLTEERDSDEEFDAPVGSGTVVEKEVPSHRPQPSVEFTPLLYREKKCVLDNTLHAFMLVLRRHWKSSLSSLPLHSLH